MKLILLLFAIGLATVAQACSKYLDGKELKEGVCLKKKDDSDDILVKACTASKICLVDGLETKGDCVDPPDVTNRLPGELCDNEKQCLSGICSNGKCKGLEAGKECKELKYCDPGLKCDKKDPASQKVCLEPSTSGQDCNSYLDCVVPLRCVGGKCVTIGSLDNDKEAKDALACKSYYLGKKKDDNLIDVCAEAPKLEGQTGPLKEPKKCNNNTNCKYNHPDIKDGCLCGKTANGGKYCKAYPGDFNLEKVSSSL